MSDMSDNGGVDLAQQIDQIPAETIRKLRRRDAILAAVGAFIVVAIATTSLSVLRWPVLILVWFRLGLDMARIVDLSKSVAKPVMTHLAICIGAYAIGFCLAHLVM